MNNRTLVILFLLTVLVMLIVPPAGAVEPRWTLAATTSGDLSGVAISEDGSTAVAYGDQLIVISRGQKLWSAWSGKYLVLSADGNYILTSREQIVRMISRSGTMLWDASLDVPVTDMAMTPDASLIAAGGGGRVQLFSKWGAGIEMNTSIPVNHIRIFPDADQIVMTTKNGVQISNLTLCPEWEDANMTQDLLEVAADGSSFVTVTNNRVRLYTRDGDLLWEHPFPGGNALALAWSRDGSTIVIGRDDKTMEVLDDQGTLLWTADAAHWITSVAVSDDGNMIVAGSMDKTISFYDHAGTKLGSFTANNPVKTHSVAMSGDGSVIVAVDASFVYGFSRQQFTEPSTTPTATTATPAPVISAVTAATSESTPLLSASPAPRTTQAPLPLWILVSVVALLILCRSRSS